jgi:hypothetical protein
MWIPLWIVIPIKIIGKRTDAEIFIGTSTEMAGS